MSQKTDQRILNISGIDGWSSRGFYGRKKSKYLEEDFKIRKFLQQELKKAGIETIEIERGSSAIKIIIRTGRPALVIGRGGDRIESLKKGVDKIISDVRKSWTKKGDNRKRISVKLEVVPVKNAWESAQLAAGWIAQQLERRTRYRRSLKMALSKIMQNKSVKGARVQVSGRLNGISMARTEWLQEGRLPRQSIRSTIDYGFAKARCTYGVLGVKVWIYKGESFG